MLGKPVVALESTIITHGMPYPQNLTTALQLESIIENNGGVPATIALMNGEMKVGLDHKELEFLARCKDAVKTSRRDIAGVLASGKTGSTTVSGTMIAAHKAGIKVFATGGIGGVHRGGNFDISADLTELGRTPIAVVCAGVKSILDIENTLEYLETQGVSVVTVGNTDNFPAFYTADSGFKSTLSLDIPQSARLIKANLDLGLGSGMVFAVPIPAEYSYSDPKELERIIKHSVDECKRLGIRGKDITPFLLDQVKTLTGGDSLKASNFC